MSATVAAPSHSRFTPTSFASPERLHALDILRGLALFGMILVHLKNLAGREVTGLEGWIPWGVGVFVEQKAWGTFAFLFGVGFAVLLRRLDARGEWAVPIFLRRLTALALFGVIAELFGFRILFGYAWSGVALLLIRRWSSRALMVTAVAAAASQPLIAEINALVAWWTSAPPRPSPAAFELARAVTTAMQQGDYAAVMAARWAQFVGTLPFFSWQGLVPDTNAALFIFGLLAVRHGVLDQPLRHVRLIGGWMTFGVLSWATSLLVLKNLPQIAIPNVGWPLVSGLGLIAERWLCFTYIGAVVLLLAKRPQWTTRLSFARNTGRMALTNYIVHAVVLDALTANYGLGLKLRPIAYIALALLLFGTQAALSTAWLARFQFGPLEWIWRSATYARRPSRVRIVPSVAAGGVASRMFGGAQEYAAGRWRKWNSRSSG